MFCFLGIPWIMGSKSSLRSEYGHHLITGSRSCMLELMMVVSRALPRLTVWCSGFGFGWDMYKVNSFSDPSWVSSFMASVLKKWFFKLGHWEGRRGPVLLLLFFPGKWIYFEICSPFLFVHHVQWWLGSTHNHFRKWTLEPDLGRGESRL